MLILKKFLPLSLARPRLRFGLERCIQRGPCLKGLLLRNAIPLQAPYFTRRRGNLNEWPPINLVQSLLLVVQPTLLKKSLHTAGRTLVFNPWARTITLPARVRSVTLVDKVNIVKTLAHSSTASNKKNHTQPRT